MASSAVIAVSYLVFLILLIVVCGSQNYSVTRVWYLFMFLLVLVLANMAFNLIPNKSLDLFRLQQIVDKMRISGKPALTLIVEGIGDEYQGLITFNMLCYIVTLIGNQWMATISVLVTLSLLLYVIVSYLICKGYTCKALLPAICLTFMGLQMHYVFSGIRNGMAVSLTIFALYRMYRHNKILVSSVVLYVLAMMMHPAVLVVAPILCIAIYGRHQIVFRFGVLFIIPLIYAIAQIMITIPNPLIQYVGNRVFFYEDHNYAADRPEMIANILMFLAIGISYWWLKREDCFEQPAKKDVIYTNFYYMLGFAMLGCVMKRDFINRIGYIMGILSVPLMCKAFFDIRRHRLIGNTKIIWLALVFSMLVCCGKVFYDTLWVLTKWSFM